MKLRTATVAVAVMSAVALGAPRVHADVMYVLGHAVAGDDGSGRIDVCFPPTSDALAVAGQLKLVTQLSGGAQLLAIENAGTMLQIRFAGAPAGTTVEAKLPDETRQQLVALDVPCAGTVTAETAAGTAAVAGAAAGAGAGVAAAGGVSTTAVAAGGGLVSAGGVLGGLAAGGTFNGGGPSLNQGTATRPVVSRTR